MLRPAVRLREGDVITLPTRDGEYEVAEVVSLADDLVELELLQVREPVIIADSYALDAGHLVNVVRRARQDHVEVRWTILDPQTDQIVAGRRTDRVDLTDARARGYDDVTGIQRTLAVKQFSSATFAEYVVILSVKEV